MREMKVCELMIDDWVLDKKTNRPYKIIGTNDLLFHNDYSPIPLTAEILEKNGFKKQYGNDWCYYKYKDDDTSKESLYLILYGIDSLYLEIAAFTNASGEYNRMGVCYVHELQHALRLCNIDKEIKL